MLITHLCIPFLRSQQQKSLASIVVAQTRAKSQSSASTNESSNVETRLNAERERVSARYRPRSRIDRSVSVSRGTHGIARADCNSSGGTREGWRKTEHKSHRHRGQRSLLSAYALFAFARTAEDPRQYVSSRLARASVNEEPRAINVKMSRNRVHRTFLLFLSSIYAWRQPPLNPAGSRHSFNIVAPVCMHRLLSPRFPPVRSLPSPPFSPFLALRRGILRLSTCHEIERVRALIFAPCTRDSGETNREILSKYDISLYPRISPPLYPVNRSRMAPLAQQVGSRYPRWPTPSFSDARRSCTCAYICT